jgi:hypothetical protein
MRTALWQGFLVRSIRERQQQFCTHEEDVARQNVPSIIRMFADFDSRRLLAPCPGRV